MDKKKGAKVINVSEDTKRLLAGLIALSPDKIETDIETHLDSGTNKGGRPSHTTKVNRQRLSITMSKETIQEMNAFLNTDVGRVARNRSHLLEVAVIKYMNESVKE